MSKKSVKKYKNCKKCKTRKRFLYNPDDPKKSFDVYIDKNPRDTIHIKYKTVDDVKTTIRKLERLYKDKKYTQSDMDIMLNIYNHLDRNLVI